MKHSHWMKYCTWGILAVLLLTYSYLKTQLHNLGEQYQNLQQWENLAMASNHPFDLQVIHNAMEANLAFTKLKQDTPNPRIFLSHELKTLNLMNQEMLESAPLERMWSAWNILHGMCKMNPITWSAKVAANSNITLAIESDWASLNHWIMYFGTGAAAAHFKSLEAIQLPNQKIALKITF